MAMGIFFYKLKKIITFERSKKQKNGTTKGSKSANGILKLILTITFQEVHSVKILDVHLKKKDKKHYNNM